VLIGFIITLAGWRILREGLRVLLEATPRHVDITGMLNTLSQIPGVKDVHDVHVWSISPELNAMSCHVLIDDLSTSQASSIREKIEDIVRQQFRIKHTTLQMECQLCSPNDVFCNLAFESGDEEAQRPPPQQ